MRKVASENMQVLGPALCLLTEISSELLFLLFSFGYSTTYLQNLDQIIAHSPARLVPNPRITATNEGEAGSYRS